MKASELYKVYKEWAEENEYKPTGSRTFGEEAKRRLHFHSSNGIRYFRGISN